MAEGLLFDAAWRLLEVLGSLAVEEIKLASGVKDEIRQLSETVRSIKAVLRDGEEQHIKKNRQVTEWLLRLKDAVYDADDLLDDFASELKKPEEKACNKMVKKVRNFFSRSKQLAYGHKIKVIRERLDKIASDRKFHLNEHRDDKQVMNIEREQTHSFVRQENVIGRDKDKNAIIQLLFDLNYFENVSILPIVGIGGVGKTTLVQSVYNTEKVINHYELRLWVCVSDVFNVKMIVEKIIKSATNDEPKNLEMDQLQNHLRKQIDGKRYLLVLDDVWNEDPLRWDELKNLLMNGARGSKILVTTRTEKVAKITSNLPSYVLRELDEDDSWFLFMQIASKYGLELKDTRLVATAKDILAKCAGVPLAIKTIGHLLCNDNTEYDWLHFRDIELSQIAQEDTGILPILELSYRHLPSHLKHCFAYCALFPKDYFIEKQKLIYLWMAQGFLYSEHKNKCIEDVGNEYFMSLLSRSFFQEAIYDERGNVTQCKMHDLMHDLAQSVAGIECAMVTSNTESIDERCRHVSFDDHNIYSSWKFPYALTKAKRIRTFLMRVDLNQFVDVPNYFFEFDDFCCSKMSSCFMYLRALNLSALKMRKVSSLIGDLKYLRYLDLSNNCFKELPNSVSKLRNLEILDVSWTDLEELPKDTKNMVSLKHLLVQNCRLVKMPHALGLLTSLQTLPLFIVKNETGAFKELNRLSNLRGELTICIEEYCKENASLANLEAKPHLESLKLEWRSSDRIGMFNIDTNDEVLLEGLKPHPNLKSFAINSFMGANLSGWLASLTNLTSITLERCEHCRQIPVLDQLASLERLYLYCLFDLEYISEKASKSSSTQPTIFFPSLKDLTIRGCHRLKGWWRRDDYDGGATTQLTTELPSFPCLSKLTIENCSNLSSMPLYPSVEELKLESTSSKPLQQTMMSMISVAPSTSSGFSGPLSKLKSLYLSRIHDLESLPKEGLRNLTSLVDMTILSCPNFCDNFIDDDDYIQGQALRSLHYVGFHNLPKLVSLPKGLQYATTLKIFLCHNLTYLPKQMQFQNLEIVDCYGLSRCYMDDNWSNIAHIPNIKVDWKWIQKEGCYQLHSEGCSSP